MNCWSCRCIFRCNNAGYPAEDVAAIDVHLVHARTSQVTTTLHILHETMEAAWPPRPSHGHAVGADEASRIGKVVSIAKHRDLVSDIIVDVLQGSMVI